MHLLYDLGIWLYGLILRLISPFYAKAKLWVEGRRGIFIRLEQTVESGSHPIWFHFASLGEFEQGRSVMEGIKRNIRMKNIDNFFRHRGLRFERTRLWQIMFSICLLIHLEMHDGF